MTTDPNDHRGAGLAETWLHASPALEGRGLLLADELAPSWEQLAQEVGELVIAFERADCTLQAGGAMAAVLDERMSDVRAAYHRMRASIVASVRTPSTAASRN